MTEKIRKFVYIGAAAIIAIILGYAALVYLLPSLLPFIVSYAAARLTKRPSEIISGKLKIGMKIVHPSVALLSMLLIIGGAVYGAVRLSAEAIELISGLAEDGTLAQIIESVTRPVSLYFEKLGITDAAADRIADALSGIAANIAGSAASFISSVASAVPKILLFILIVAISTVYFALDLDNITERMLSLLPKRARAYISGVADGSSDVAKKYIRSYLVIMLVTFLMMLIGLMLLRVRYSLLIASVIAALDMLPVIGIGIVLIPWGLFMLLAGRGGMGIGLLVLYAVAAVIRQVIEPRLLGKSLGVHPLLTLALMYVGYSLFGVAGLVFMPLLAAAFPFLSRKSMPPRSDSDSAEGSSDTAL